MNGAHDLGGMHGFGLVETEPNEPVFHASWERRVFGIQIALLLRGLWGIDEIRLATESVDPARYLRTGYYEKWLETLEQLLVAKELVAPGELEQRRSEMAGDHHVTAVAHPDPEFLELCVRATREGGSLDCDSPVPPRYAPGDAVITSNAHPHGHTRLPRYARGRQGTIARVYESFPLPDLGAEGIRRPECVYSVRFEASELWGESAQLNAPVHIDLWESYLRTDHDA
jgi:nitrile hydratase beta subunit